METIVEEGELLQAKSEAQELFQFCDQDSKGFVTTDDLKQISEDLQLTVEQIEVVFQQLDKDGNGFLTADEFENGLASFLTKSEEEEDLCCIDVVVENDQDASPEGQLEISVRDKRLAFVSNKFQGVESDSVETETMQLPHLEITGILQDKAAIQLWSQIETEHPELLPVFEEFLQNLALKHHQIREETSVLQQCFNRQSVAYQQQIRVLYEEMEGQIQEEKQMIINKKIELEKHLRQEIETAVETKDNDIQELLEKWLQATKQLEIASEIKTVTQHENQKLSREKEMLEDQLDSYKQELTELHQKLDEAKASTVNVKRERFRAAFQLSEKIAWEREALVKQLDLLRSINRRLQDEKDEFEDTLLTRTKSVEDIFALTNGELPERLAAQLRFKRGSVMSDYFGVHHSRLSSTSSNPEEMNNNEDPFITSDPAEESKVNPITKIQNTNPFMRDDSITAYVNLPSRPLPKFLPTNPFSSYFQVKEEEELSSTYTSYADPELDCLDQTPEKSADKKHADATDSKPPVLCFVHPNNHQNGLFYQQSSTASKVTPLQLAASKSDDDLINFEEGENVAQPSQSQQPPIASLDLRINSIIDTDHSQLPQTLFKVVFIGDSGVGKTSLINRICGGDFTEKFCTTIGVDFRVKTIVLEGQQVVLQLWDTAGQERFRSITSQYLRKSDGVLIVYDVNSEFSFCNVCSWMASIEKVNNDNVIVALIGNKLDLGATSDKKVVPSDEGRKVAAEKDALFFETSAKDGTGIEELMLTMARNLQKKQLDDMESCVKLTESPETVLLPKKICC